MARRLQEGGQHFYLNGVRFHVFGDPDSDYASQMIHNAMIDLQKLKDRSDPSLEIINYERAPFYNVQRYFGQDEVFIYPDTRKEARGRVSTREREEVEEKSNEYYLIAFEAYNSTGQQVGYVICDDGKLGSRRLVLTDNVVNPHPIYPFNRVQEDHDEYAPDGYEEWADWYEVEKLAFAKPDDIVYPFHFPDWKLCTGWSDWDGFFRDHDNPDDYLELANPYPLVEVPYIHNIKPPDKYLFEEVDGETNRTFYDLSQHTDYEEKLMTWIPEMDAVFLGYEGTEDAFDVFETSNQYNPGSETPICCNFYDERYDEYPLPEDTGIGTIWGVKRDNHTIYTDIDSALTGVTITTKEQSCKLYTGGGIG